MYRIERILGGLFGVACGDALGATLEFMDEDEGKPVYGFHRDIIGGGMMELKPGQVTDDTIMAIAVAEGIIENPESPIEAIGDRFVKWYNSNPPDIGVACRTAIEKYIKCQDWKEAGAYAYKTLNGMNGGNGSLMRCIPVALYYRDFDKMIQYTKQQSDMTHYNKEVSRACSIYNIMVYRYLRGEDKVTVFQEETKDYPEYAKVSSMKKSDLKPSGYAVDSLQCALWCFMNYSNPEDIICQAVNLYGDPDTIGAIAGGLAGVHYGYDSIPERWRNKIRIKDRLIEIGGKLNRLK